MTCPIYLFTGFLESGKTRCIIETFEGEGFFEGEKTVLILCEEGEITYEQSFLEEYDIHIVNVEKKEELNIDLLEKIKAAFNPERVMIEYNGMWSVDLIMQMGFPKEWEMAQIVSMVDAKTFGNYISNMRSLIYEQLKYSDLIICNRCNNDIKQSMLRGNIKAINKKAQIIYEKEDGSISEIVQDELPFNIFDDPLIISDIDYGLWYMDMLDHPARYLHKEVIIKGMVLKTGAAGKNSFMLGRYAMVCCAEDTAMVGILVESKYAGELVESEWVEVVAQVEVEYDPAYGADIGFLVAKDIKATTPIDEPLVYFN